MRDKNVLNVLVISDVHAHSQDPRSSQTPSFYSTNSLFSDAGSNPLTDIPTIIKKHGLAVDWVLTPGDLGDRADPTSQKIAWEELEKIRQQTGATLLIGTTGNHDIDSRRNFPEFDPKSALQALKPMFPVSCSLFEENDGVYSDRFWSRNFVVIPFVEYDCTLVVLNSSAFHGYASDTKGPSREHLRGKISPLTLEAIKKELAGHNTRLNIVLLHHHLSKHPWIEDSDSFVIGGDKLSEYLKETGKQWLVIHGHQHVPHLSYADGTPLAPVVLSAGSVAARTYDVRGVHPRNQIHHISVHLDDMDPSGAEVLGNITSWTWAVGSGWREASVDGGLPFKCGFGYRPSAIELRNKLVTAAKTAAPGVHRWANVLSMDPKLQFLTSDDLAQVLSMVQQTGTVVDFDRHQLPEHLEWRE
ncbi:3',5'-cyclic AMP phosphodiesterase CpdA [Phyllobacterium sp. 1468]|uniref:metallophosphoesterase family protein n=1 Tax=Phyllobacterium sp. 1468 TaxID=2817759 RepID=UPI00285CB07B|nr:metallophosphoesterase [Phyllobacterium sp. 1468]MDR6632583.1 3',5'-cyclic AMP phosphodiesterase CpdA [Phyllobacterium sp. 1468]